MRRIIVGVSGASGAPLAVELLQQLQKQKNIETHLVVTDSARQTIEAECDLPFEEFCTLADYCYDCHDIGAAIASGSFRTEAMVIVPCSMKTVAGIANGYSENLLLRAADVMLKEHRTLILVPRETPLSPVHLKNMYELSQYGVRLIPPMLTYYNRPETVQDCTRHIVGKILDQLGLNMAEYKRWK